MNELTLKFISSREVAETVGKPHKELLRDIRRYSEQFNGSKIALVDFFKESTYSDAKGQERPCFLVTKKGCEFIAHKLTGVKGSEFTAHYINRFHEMEEQISAPLSELEILQRSIAILNNQDTRITKLENNMTIDHGQAQDLRQAGAKRVIDLCGGKHSDAYKEVSKKVFSELWHDFKEYFHINSYSNTLISRFPESMDYVRSWTPSNNMMIVIRNCNSQISFASGE